MRLKWFLGAALGAGLLMAHGQACGATALGTGFTDQGQLKQSGSPVKWVTRMHPAGYEVPCDEPAYILILKAERSTVVERDFLDYLKGLAERLNREQAQGTPFLLKDLPVDHPARVFSRQASPGWDSRATASQPATRSTR